MNYLLKENEELKFKLQNRKNDTNLDIEYKLKKYEAEANRRHEEVENL